MDAFDERIDRLTVFFNRDPTMLPIYLAFECRLLEVCGDTRIRVQKTQVTFANRYNFACISIPIRRKKGWPRHCLMITFGLERHGDSPASPSQPNRTPTDGRTMSSSSDLSRSTMS